MTTIDSTHTCQPEATVCAASSACAAKSAHAPNLAQIEEGITLVLKGLGEDVTRPGLVDTPSRVARACAEFLQPGFVSVEELFEKQFDVSCTCPIQMVRYAVFLSLPARSMLVLRACKYKSGLRAKRLTWLWKARTRRAYMCASMRSICACRLEVLISQAPLLVRSLPAGVLTTRQKNKTLCALSSGKIISIA